MKFLTQSGVKDLSQSREIVASLFEERFMPRHY